MFLPQTYDTQGIDLITTLFECLPRASMEPFIKDVFMLLLTRMQRSKTAKVGSRSRATCRSALLFLYIFYACVLTARSFFSLHPPLPNAQFVQGMLRFVCFLAAQIDGSFVISNFERYGHS